jgi:hypothetical protein
MENNGLRDRDNYVVWYGDRVVHTVGVVVPNKNFEIHTIGFDDEKWTRLPNEKLDTKMLRFEVFDVDRIRDRLKKIVDFLPEDVLVEHLSEMMQEIE